MTEIYTLFLKFYPSQFEVDLSRFIFKSGQVTFHASRPHKSTWRRSKSKSGQIAMGRVIPRSSHEAGIACCFSQAWSWRCPVSLLHCSLNFEHQHYSLSPPERPWYEDDCHLWWG